MSLEGIEKEVGKMVGEGVRLAEEDCWVAVVG